MTACRLNGAPQIKTQIGTIFQFPRTLIFDSKEDKVKFVVLLHRRGLGQ